MKIQEKAVNPDSPKSNAFKQLIEELLCDFENSIYHLFVEMIES